MSEAPTPRSKLDVLYHEVLGEASSVLDRMERLQHKLDENLAAAQSLPAEVKAKTLRAITNVQADLNKQRTDAAREMANFVRDVNTLSKMNLALVARLERLTRFAAWSALALLALWFALSWLLRYGVPL